MIVLGSATVEGSDVVIDPPVGQFGGVKAVRLTNYSPDAIKLGNVTGKNAGGQEYLMPFQQNVYGIESVRNPPTALGVVLGSGFNTESLFVEWSTEPEIDFPGTYPTALTQAPIVPAASTADGVVVMAAGANGQIPAQNGTDLTFYNNGTGVVYWSRDSSTVLGAGTSAQLAVGSGVTVGAGNIVYLKADASGASVSWFAD